MPVDGERVAQVAAVQGLRLLHPWVSSFTPPRAVPAGVHLIGKGDTVMALIVHFTPKGMDETKYADVLRRLEAAGAWAPQGRLHHVCYGDKRALRVTDVFDTGQSF